MLIKHLKRAFSLSTTPPPRPPLSPSTPPLSTPPSTPVPSTEEYLFFPTKVPIFPYFFYVSRINKHLYQYLQKNNIKYAAAGMLQPGESKKQFTPYMMSHMIKQLGLKEFNQVKRAGKYDDIDEMPVIDNNNNISDEELRGYDDVPVYHIDKINQIYPIVSCCKLFLAEAQKNYYMYLRSEIRLEVNVQKYANHEQGKPLMYVSGKKIKNQQASEIGTLLQIYNRIMKVSEINMPIAKQSLTIKSIQLIGGFISTLSYFTPIQKYRLFSMITLAQRTKFMGELLKEYAQILETQWKLLNDRNPQENNDRQQKQYFKEIYEQVQSFLGHKADKDFIKKVQTKIASGNFPEQILKVIEYELQNIQDLGEGNPEINKKKHFINLLIDYPFGIVAKQTFDLQKSKQILDEDHYGMKKVKQRILQFIAVSKIKGEFKSKVLLLHGPPGVGKTSIVKSIAKCLNRPYGRISLGGQYDTSIMKGHRKTYIGAYPGKIFDTISKAKVQNPVILLDEIDKVQSRQGGASLQDVIMQVLDPIQNHKFKDEYMDVQIDLSKVLFVCTANELQTIFPPLLDRLQRIQVTGYTTGQKKQIFRKYVQKNTMESAGIPDELQTRIDFTDEALHSLIQGYCKEAGIRNLVRKAHKIFNKTAYRYVKNQDFDSVITPKTLKQYLGEPRFAQARLFQKIPPKGVIIGLAYNAYGGSIMYIEAAAAHIKQIAKQQQKTTTIKQPTFPIGSLSVTGNLHNVMKQSCQLAYSYAKYITSAFFNNNFLQVNDIHLNFPQIQIGKDGPSAGVAITCSLVSLALGKPSIREIAMTGEITLSGKVSAIGGVKEKTMGAKRQGIKCLIFPEDNRRDVEELDQEVKEGVQFLFAGHFFEVMQIVFGLKINENAQNEQKVQMLQK